jgi:hypothetical protein
VEKKRYNMSWGPATVFIHRRLLPSGEPAGPAVLHSYQTSPPQNLSYPGDGTEEGGGNRGGLGDNEGPLEVTGMAMKLNLGGNYNESGGAAYIDEDDVDSGFYSHDKSSVGPSEGGGGDEAASSVFTPSTSVNSSFDTQASGASWNTPNTSYNSEFSRPPTLDTTSGLLEAPLSPGMRRIYAEEQLGVMTSPKDTMLMQRKRMRSKGQGAKGGGGSNLFA